MLKKYKKQITNSFIYIFSTILSRAIPFFLLPVLTYYLSREDYGMLGFISSIMAIVSIYIGLKPSLFIIVKAPQMEKHKISIYIFNMFFIGVYSFFIVSIILLLAKQILFPNITTYIFIFITLLALFNISNEILEAVLQIEKKAILYALYQFFKTIIAIALALILIILFKLGWEGKFFADFIVAILFAIFSFIYLNRNNYIKPVFNFSKQKELIRYLFPLSFHVLGLVLMVNIDRVFLVKMKGLEATGLYNVAYTMGALLGVVHDALLKVWAPEFYKRIKNASQEARKKILKFQYLYIAGSFILYGIFIIIMPYIFKLMIDEKFHQSYEVVPIVALGLTFEAIRKIFISYHYNLNKTTRIAYLTLFAGLINILLNNMLIPKYGINGAAYATLFSYIIVALLTVFDVNKIEKNINWKLN